MAARGAASGGEQGRDVVEVLLSATVPRDQRATGAPARFALVLAASDDPVQVRAEVARRLAGLTAQVEPLSSLDPRVLLVELPGRDFGGEPAAAFSAAHALEVAFGLEAAEPDLPTQLFPEPDPRATQDGLVEEDLGSFPPWCWAAAEPDLDDRPQWALEAVRAPAAWAYSRSRQRPAQGEGVVVAQPDTGITAHPELDGAALSAGTDVLDGDPDATDPLVGANPGHGTGTASVLVSPSGHAVVGSAPRVRLVPVRAIDSVARISQVSVARAVDWAVEQGAHVITMSLGGLFSPSLHRALRRAVGADVVVLAAAGNCVGQVVWPARYDECIAVAGVDAHDLPWVGSCRGSSVDVSAPAQHVPRATVPGGAAPGQGTSFAVAIAAGVAALWLAHHGRANLVAEARARGETVQAMFRRLAGATARRPPGWDPLEMGAGIIDADALLRADDLDLDLDRESVASPADPREAARVTVESLVAEVTGVLGPAATGRRAPDWYRHGPEVSWLLLERQLAAPPGAGAGEVPETAGPAVSPELDAAVGDPALRAALGLTPAAALAGAGRGGAP